LAKLVDRCSDGRRSDGSFFHQLKQENGIFQGKVFFGKLSGGFSSLRHTAQMQTVGKTPNSEITFKGDGKGYQFRIKIKPYDGILYFRVSNHRRIWQ